MRVEQILDTLRGVDPSREIRFADKPRNRVELIAAYLSEKPGTVWFDIDYPSGQGNRARSLTVGEMALELSDRPANWEVRFADSELSSIRLLGIYGAGLPDGRVWFDVIEVGTRRETA